MHNFAGDGLGTLRHAAAQPTLSMSVQEMDLSVCNMVGAGTEGLPLQPQPINADTWDSEKIAKRQKVPPCCIRMCTPQSLQQGMHKSWHHCLFRSCCLQGHIGCQY